MGLSGGCSCGAVRYTISAEPIRGFQCQCRNCQTDSGGRHSSVLVFSRAAFEISGEVREIARTSDLQRFPVILDHSMIQYDREAP
jgi:hypothetical protein